MEEVRLIDVDVDGIVTCQNFGVDIVLDRRDVMVDKQLFSRHVTRKAAYAVIQCDDVGIEAAD